MGNRLDILAESLDKKIQVLLEIQKHSKRQEEAVRGEEVDLEAFDEAVDAKDLLIDKLGQLDDGFEVLYAEIAEELEGNRERYAAQIKKMQEKIARVTELSVSIQAQEERNKQLVEQYFARTRQGIREGRKSSRAAYDYYKNMSGAGYPRSQVWDSKQ